MNNENAQKTLSVQIANQIVNIANNQLEGGTPALEIAAGLRHAAANFSAFAISQSKTDTEGPQKLVDDFIHCFEYYLERHASSDKPQGGLFKLIEDVKNDF